MNSIRVAVGTLTALLPAAAPAQCGPTEIAKLQSGQIQQLEYFGHALAAQGDTLLIGANRKDLGDLAQAGVVHVFKGADAIWREQTVLSAADAGPGDWFGFSVGLDQGSAVIGAYGRDTAGLVNAGSAYVMTRAGDAWTQQARLDPPAPETGSFFGFATAISADLIVVGAPLADHSGRSDAGAAYVFARSGAVWSLEATLTAPDAADSAWFGSAVAIDGGTVVVGSYFHGELAGAAYVFTRSGTLWPLQAQLFAETPIPGAAFGYAVAIEQDTMLVSARRDAVGTVASAGSATIFTRSGGAWSPQARLTASDPARADSFGFSVALSGDTALVGAVFSDAPGLESSGSAYLFRRQGAAWPRLAKLTASDIKPRAYLGHAVALSDEVAFISALQDSHSGVPDAGAVYAFNLDGAPWLTEQPAPDSRPCPGGQLLLTAAADGPGTLAYRWCRDGVPISDGPGGASAGGGLVSGAHTPTLRIGSAQPSDTGLYDLVVTGSCGSTLSDPAAVAVDDCCPADYTLDGIIDFPDFLEFISLFDAGDPRADLDSDGVVDFADYQVFLNFYDGGC